MISSSIFNKPYWLGNPLVLLTLIVVSPIVVITVVMVPSTITSGVRLSNFKYSYKLSEMSTGPPWYSWEI